MTIPNDKLPWVILTSILLLGVLANLALPFIYPAVMDLITQLNTLR